MNSLLIFGWPGAGKTSLGEALARASGYTHHDLELPEAQRTQEQRDFHQGWEDFRAGRGQRFLQTLRERACVVTAGAQAQDINSLAALARSRQEAGCHLFWLEGTRDELRKRWLARERSRPEGGASVGFFDAQADALTLLGPAWRSVCAPGIIDTTLPGVTSASLVRDVLAAVGEPQGAGEPGGRGSFL